MPFDGRSFEQRDEVLEHLRQARERIARGWCRFIREDDEGRVCLLGALYGWYSVTDSPELLALINELPPEQRKDGLFVSSALVSYNDKTGRTQAEIVALFDRAIAAREQDG